MAEQRIFISLSEGERHLAIDGDLNLLKVLFETLNQPTSLKVQNPFPILKTEQETRVLPVQGGAY